MYISGNNYIYKPKYDVKRDNIDRKSYIYLGLQQLKAELVESPKKDLIFKYNASLYIEKILEIYKKFLNSLADGVFESESNCTSLLYCLKRMIELEYKSTPLSNTILQDTINTIYGDDTISVVKYNMINEDWTDAVFKYITSNQDEYMLTKDKVYPAIKNAPLLEIYIPKEAYKYNTAISSNEELRVLLSKLGVIDTLELIDILFSKIFIFSIK